MGLCLQLPVHPHLLHHCCLTATGTGKRGYGDVMTSTWIWLKWWRIAQIGGLTLLSQPIYIQWQDKSKTAGDRFGCSEWSAVSFVSHCALLALHSTLCLPSCPLKQLVVLSMHSTRSSLYMLRQTSPNSPVALGPLATLSWFSLPVYVNSCSEPQVRIGYLLGTTCGWATLKGHDLSPPPEVLPLVMPHTPCQECTYFKMISGVSLSR